MSIEWKSGDMAVRKDGGPVFQLRDRFYSGLMGETTMWSVAVSPYDPIGGSLPQACLRRPIPTLEENQARLRQEQAYICKRLGYGVGPKVEVGKFPSGLTAEDLGLSGVQEQLDHIAELARTAIYYMEYAHTLFPMRCIEEAKIAVEFILAEVTKP